MVQKTKTLVVPSASLVARGITVAAWDRGLFPVSPSNCFFRTSESYNPLFDSLVGSGLEGDVMNSCSCSIKDPYELTRKA